MVLRLTRGTEEYSMSQTGTQLITLLCSIVRSLFHYFLFLAISVFSRIFHGGKGPKYLLK